MISTATTAVTIHRSYGHEARRYLSAKKPFRASRFRRRAAAGEHPFGLAPLTQPTAIRPEAARIRGARSPPSGMPPTWTTNEFTDPVAPLPPTRSIPPTGGWITATSPVVDPKPVVAPSSPERGTTTGTQKPLPIQNEGQTIMTARISIDGNLVADPDFGVGDSGTSWAHLRVASHDRIRRDGEWVSTDAEYYN